MKPQTFFFLFAIFIFGFSKNHTTQAQDNGLRFVNLFDSTTKPGVACYRIPAIVTAPNGDVVVARIQGDTATVKRIYFEKEQIRLQPENARMEPIYAAYSDVEVVGKVVSLLRRY